MDSSKIKELFKNITVWKKGGERAPNKPLLALYALGRIQRKGSRLIGYLDVDRDLKKLLFEFGPARRVVHPDYPFWHLQNDGLWQLQGAEQLTRRQGGTRPLVSELK